MEPKILYTDKNKKFISDLFNVPEDIIDAWEAGTSSPHPLVEEAIIECVPASEKC